MALINLQTAFVIPYIYTTEFSNISQVIKNFCQSSLKTYGSLIGSKLEINEYITIAEYLPCGSIWLKLIDDTAVEPDPKLYNVSKRPRKQFNHPKAIFEVKMDSEEVKKHMIKKSTGGWPQKRILKNKCFIQLKKLKFTKDEPKSRIDHPIDHQQFHISPQPQLLPHHTKNQENVQSQPELLPLLIGKQENSEQQQSIQNLNLSEIEEMANLFDFYQPKSLIRSIEEVKIDLNELKRQEKRKSEIDKELNEFVNIPNLSEFPILHIPDNNSDVPSQYVN